MELRGISCIKFEELSQPRQSIICARSFGKLIVSLDDMREAIATYTSRAAEKLRQQGSATTFLQVFLFTDPFKEEPQYSNYLTLQLPYPSDFTPDLVKFAIAGLEKIFKPDFRYKKAGVMFMGLVDRNHTQLNLFEERLVNTKDRTLMAAIDRINSRYGPDTIKLAAQGGRKNWKMIRSHLTPRYTTSWDEIPRATA